MRFDTVHIKRIWYGMLHYHVNNVQVEALTLYSTLNTSCFRYAGDRVKGLYNGEGVAYFTGDHVYQVFMSVNV